MTLIPLAVAGCYGVTALAVYLDAGRAARRIGPTATAGKLLAA